jgi:hypothetical protein
MANWLEKALGREEAEPVRSVPFSVTCQCGFQIDGQRQERAKRVICSECGAGHFILPLNRYPTSQRSFFAEDDLGITSAQEPKRKKKPPATEIEFADDPESSDDNDPFIDEDNQQTDPQLDLVEDAWSTDGDQSSYADDDLDLDDDDDGDDYELADSDAEIELPPQLPRSKKKKKSSGSRTPARKKTVAAPASSKSGNKKREPRIEVPTASDERSGQRLRIAGVCVLILVAIGAMIAFAIRGRTHDQAEIAMREGRDIGEAALRERDFATARLKLGEAFRAMELLGIDEEIRAETRNLWLQAEAGFGLLDSTDVVEIALLAEEMIPEPDDEGKIDDEDWKRQFHTRFFDRWLCIQVEHADVVSGDDEFGRRVVFPAIPLVHLAGVDTVLDGSSEGGLWFAGPIKSFQRDPMDDSVWLIEFDSSRVIACDRTQSLVLPMLSEDEQQAAIAALAAESDSEKSIDDNEQREPDDE